MSELKPSTMTDDERLKLIAWLESRAQGSTMPGASRMYKLALDAIRAQPANEPLTLDELRKMDGSPVWWWNKSHAPVCTICIVRFGEVSFADFDYSHEDSTGIVQYKRWIKWGFKPYHRKPEGSTKK